MARIAELEDRLNQHSGNSSKPSLPVMGQAHHHLLGRALPQVKRGANPTKALGVSVIQRMNG